MGLMLKFILLSVIYLCAASVSEYKSYENYKVFEVKGSSVDVQHLVETMKERDESLVHDGNSDSVHLMVAPHLLSVFQDIVASKKLDTKLIFDDYSRIIRTEKQRTLRGFSWNAYYDVDDIYSYLQNVSKSHADSTEVIVGGKSYEGREILGLRINTPSEDDKPVMFIESGIHAREWIAPATTTYFINELLTSSDPEIIAMRDQFDWRIFPTVNPDGYHYTFTTDRMWRKTRSRSPNGCYGADPNRNWNYNWLKYGATSNPCDYQTFGGSKAFSEVETSTLATYISSIENLLGYVAFHSYGQMLLVPYSDSVEHTDNYDDLIKIGNTSLEYGYQVNKAKYDGPATAAEILYKASGGSMDWVRDALGTRLVYTYELRGFYFHWPPSRIHEQGDEVTQMMLGLVTEAKNMGYF